jgi:hypothetical protein
MLFKVKCAKKVNGLTIGQIYDCVHILTVMSEIKFVLGGDNGEFTFCDPSKLLYEQSEVIKIAEEPAKAVKGAKK